MAIQVLCVGFLWKPASNALGESSEEQTTKQLQSGRCWMTSILPHLT